MKTTGIADVLREALAPEADQIDVAFIFGSVAAGTDREDSDIDVMVVTDLELRRLLPALDRAEKALGREIHLVRRSAQELGSRIRSGHHLTLSIMARPKLFVIGDDDELRALVEGRQSAPSSHVA